MLDSSHQSKRFAFCCRPHLASGNNLHRGPALRNATGISHPEGFHRFFKSYPHYKKRPVKDRPLFMVQGEGCASLARISLFGASSCTNPCCAVCVRSLRAKSKSHHFGDSMIWCRGRDSNPRRHKPADLQSAVFDRFTTPA